MAREAPGYPSELAARYRALLEINELIAAHRHFADFFRELSQSLSRIIPFEGIGVSLYDVEQGKSRLYLLQTGHPSDFPVGEEFQLNETPAAEILQNQKPIYIPALEKETRFGPLRNLLSSHNIRSYCVLPLSTARGCLGGLNLGSSRLNAYTPDDIAFLQLAARQAAVVLESIQSHESSACLQQQLAAERDHLRLLLRVNTAIADKLDTRELFSAISICLREALNVEYASLMLWDEDVKMLRRHTLDFPESAGLLQENEAVPVENTIVGEAFSKGIPVTGQRADIARMPVKVAGNLLREGLCSVCAVPLMSRKRTLGTLNVGSKREEAFSEPDIKLLQEVATQFAVALDNALAYGRIEVLNTKLSEEKLYLADEIRSNYFLEEIIGKSLPLQNVLRQIEVVAPSESTVIIYGETGTGKELAARAIHNLSARKQSTFVKLNCAAIPTGLMESEMFGHEKGAFTGAVTQRIGRFELANNGTLFLDEIGEIPLELQPKLLRVLQEQEFERLGSVRTVRVKVRLVAATNKDLQAMVKRGEFRADLYYRLNVFPIVMPPLRERRDDIPQLVRYFAQQVARRMGKRIETIHAEVMDELVNYSWPGNIRELQNIIERAVILSPGTMLQVPVAELRSSAASSELSPQTMEDAERAHILKVLEDVDWIVGGPRGAAARLGMKRSTLQSRMQKLHIHRLR